MLSRTKIKELLKNELKQHENVVPLTDDEIEEFVGSYSGSDRIVTFDEIEVEESTGLPTGFEGVDNLIKGFYPEQVITLTAFPKHGKTTFTFDMARNIGEKKCLFLSLEQTPADLKRQWVENNFDIPNCYTPLETDEVLTHTEWIEWKIIETQYISKKDTGEPIKGVFIDHFGYIDWQREHGENPADAIRRVMQELKRIARRTNTFIVVIVHVNKEDQTAPPTTKDLQGSSGYHQVSDTVMSLWRETYKDGKETVKTKNVLLQVIANRRFGDEGSAKYVFKEGRFVESNWIGYEAEQKQLEQYEEMEYAKGF